MSVSLKIYGTLICIIFKNRESSYKYVKFVYFKLDNALKLCFNEKRKLVLPNFQTSHLIRNIIYNTKTKPESKLEKRGLNEHFLRGDAPTYSKIYPPSPLKIQLFHPYIFIFFSHLLGHVMWFRLLRER